MMQRKIFVSGFAGVVGLAAALFLAVLPGGSRALEAQSVSTGTLIVHVTGMRNTKGNIRAALFMSAKGFPSDASQAVQTQAADIDPKSRDAQIVFKDLRESVYAVSVFHDENMNQKLDKNFLGIPKEGYGASNNPRKRMGPPSFDEAKFELNGEQSIEIKLMY